MQVRHGEREIEINAFARWLHDQVLPSLATTPRGSGPADFGTRNYEQLAGPGSMRRALQGLRKKTVADRKILICRTVSDPALSRGFVFARRLTSGSPAMYLAWTTDAGAEPRRRGGRRVHHAA